MKRRTAVTRVLFAATSFISMRTSDRINVDQRFVKTNKVFNLGILIFNDVEELDFVGPLQVFHVANDAAGTVAFRVFTVSLGNKNITAVNNMQVVADYTKTECPAIDILLIPGGIGRKAIMTDPSVLDWVNTQYKKIDLLLSVCTGAFILGHAGLLKYKEATTNMQCYSEFRQAFPDTHLKEGVKYVKDGNIVTSGGISAGINMSLFVVGELLGSATATKTADLMEYDYYIR